MLVILFESYFFCFACFLTLSLRYHDTTTNVLLLQKTNLSECWIWRVIVVDYREISLSQLTTRHCRPRWLLRRPRYTRTWCGQQRVESMRLKQDASARHQYCSLPSSHCVVTTPLRLWQSSLTAVCSTSRYLNIPYKSRSSFYSCMQLPVARKAKRTIRVRFTCKIVRILVKVIMWSSPMTIFYLVCRPT